MLKVYFCFTAIKSTQSIIHKKCIDVCVARNLEKRKSLIQICESLDVTSVFTLFCGCKAQSAVMTKFCGH